MGLFDQALKHSLPLAPKALVKTFAKKYIAGASQDEAVRVVKQLNEIGALATVDVLGEEVSDPELAKGTVEEYSKILERIDTESLRCNISVKLSALGLNISRDLCLDTMASLLTRARNLGIFVRIDMEDSEKTEDTLFVYREMARQFGSGVGVVLQAMLHRSLEDSKQLSSLEHCNIRLCKGIYLEHEEIAYQGFEEVQASYLSILNSLLDRGAYVALATHDESLIAQAIACLNARNIERDRFEFQMLLGVTEKLRGRLIEEGFPLRVYVPYGQDWYAYSVRRLKENPTIMRHALASLFVNK